MTQNYTLSTKYFMATRRRPWTLAPNLDVIFLFRSVLKVKHYGMLRNIPSCSLLLAMFTHWMKLLFFMQPYL